MLKVRVQNFQSIKDSTVDIDGFTVITGANNSGKSAFVRAIRGLFTNARGHHFVRTGATHCSVTLIFPDAQTVTWEKGKAVNRYIVNGKVLDKVGIGVPPEVQAFGVSPVTLGGQEYWPQIASQFSGQVFLIDQPGSVLAEAVSDIEKVSKLNKALKQAESDKRENNSKLSIRNTDLKKAEAELNLYQGLEIVEELYKQIEALNTKALTHKKGIGYITKLNTNLTDTKKTLSNLTWSENFSFGNINNIVNEVSSLSSTLQDVRKLTLGVNLQRAVVKSLEGPLANPALSVLTEPHKDLTTLVENIVNIKALRLRLTNANKDVNSYSIILNSLDIPDTDKLVKLSQVHKTVEGYRSNSIKFKGDLQVLEATIKKQESQLELLTKDISKTLMDLGQCPTCGTVCSKELAHD